MPKRKEGNDDTQPMHPPTCPTTLQEPQSVENQATPSRREAPLTWHCCPDQTGPRVSLDTQSKVDIGFPRRPSRWNGALQGGTASGSDEMTRLSLHPGPQKTWRNGAATPSFAAQDHAPPWSCSHHQRLFGDTGAWHERQRHATSM
jgi:hypothetical protein